MISVQLSIVIPTYNEKENIAILIPKIEETLNKHKVDAEIVIIDDNSQDETGYFAKELNKKFGNIVVVIRTKERGIASAWFHGYNISKGDYIATMDADLCHDPEDLMRMYHYLPENDMVIGSRYIQGGSGMKDKNMIAIFASRLAQILTSLIVGIKGHDLTHSFRIFKKDVFNSIKNDLKSKGNVFLMEFLYYTTKKGYKVKEIPITYGIRKFGKTKLNVYIEGIRFFISALIIYFNDKITKWVKK